MSRRIEFLVIFVVAFGASWLSSWIVNPANTGVGPWLVATVGEGWARAVRYLVVGSVVALTVWLIRIGVRPRRGGA